MYGEKKECFGKKDEQTEIFLFLELQQNTIIQRGLITARRETVNGPTKAVLFNRVHCKVYSLPKCSGVKSSPEIYLSKSIVTDGGSYLK